MQHLTTTHRVVAFLLLCVPMPLLMTACGEDDHDHGTSDEASQLFSDAFVEVQEGKTDNLSCSGVVVPDQDFFDKRVALTFDDGPNPATTPKVLDILKEQGIIATFFINGNRVQSDETREILQRILDEGHLLANHSHAHKNLRNVSQSELEAQVGNTTRVIESAGVEPVYFRFPFGSSNCNTAQYVRDQGYTITGWHVDSGDWCFASSTGGVGHCAERTFAHVPDQYRDDMVGFTIDQTERKNGGILLFHDIHAFTANSIEKIILELKDRGYTFTNIDDIAAFPLLNGATPPERPFTGTHCEGEDECGYSTPGGEGFCFNFAVGEDGDSGFCTVECEGYCNDRSGYAPTFCTSLDGVTGNCVSKATPENGECSTIPGTKAQLRDRFVGSSSAPRSQATVCVP